MTNRMIEKNIKKKFNRTTFCISGAGKKHLKNFENIFENFYKYLNLKNSNKKFQIILNGKIEKEIMNLIKKYKLNKYIKYYKKYISEDLLIKNIKKSHYTIIPTYKNSRYGKYAISGNFGDSFAFKVPILIPNHYAKNYKFKKYVLKYNEKYFYKNLKSLINLDKYDEKLNFLEKDRKNFSLETFSKKFKKILK